VPLLARLRRIVARPLAITSTAKPAVIEKAAFHAAFSLFADLRGGG